MEKLLNDNIAQQVKEVFIEALLHPVKILFFGNRDRCEFCEPALALLEELVPLSDKLALSVHDMEDDPITAQKYRVDKTPGIVLAARDGETITDYGVRFAGMPSGHEFTSLINSIIMVSQRSGGLDETSRKFLSTVKSDVILQVFVTPT